MLLGVFWIFSGCKLPFEHGSFHVCLMYSLDHILEFESEETVTKHPLRDDAKKSSAILNQFWFL